LADRRRAILAAALCSALCASGANAQNSSRIANGEETFTGAYLAARTARIERDMDSAALFYGRALRADPTNPELLNWTFQLRVISGDLDQVMPLASRVIAQDKTSDLAR